MQNAHFHAADIYGQGLRTLDLTVPEPVEQEAMTGHEADAPSPAGQNHAQILVWFGVIMVFIALFNLGRRKFA